MRKIRSLLNLPPTGLVFASIGSAQLGSAIAKYLFTALNPMTVVLLRVGFAAILLLVLWRPQMNAAVRSTKWALILFGLSLALMNLTFYLAIERIPIGIAVALEFTGPLGVAVVTSRKRLDLLWVTLAATGILLLTPVGESAINLLGVGLALLAGGFWAAYILLTAQVGRALAGGAGLAIAMTIAALVLLPVGLVAGGTALLNPQLVLIGLSVAILSSAIPYSMELEALRFLPVQVFGVLLSLEPVAAALAGFIVLGETLSIQAMVAILLITIAAAGAAKFSSSVS